MIDADKTIAKFFYDQVVGAQVGHMANIPNNPVLSSLVCAQTGEYSPTEAQFAAMLREIADCLDGGEAAQQIEPGLIVGRLMPSETATPDEIPDEDDYRRFVFVAGEWLYLGDHIRGNEFITDNNKTKFAEAWAQWEEARPGGWLNT